MASYSILTILRKAFTLTVDGFYALRTVISGDQSSFTMNGNYPVEGRAAGRNVIRSSLFTIEPGATPNTNINITMGGTAEFNTPTITNATNLGKNSTVGSFTLSSSGELLDLSTTEDIIGILGVSITTQDLNSSSTSEIYYVSAGITSGDMRMFIRKRGTSSNVDWTSILDAGDKLLVLITYITST